MMNEVCYENSYSSGKQQVIKSMCEKISQCESVNARTEQFCPCRHNIKVVYERDWINDTEDKIPVCVEIDGVHIETEMLRPKCEAHVDYPFCPEHKSCGRHLTLKGVYRTE